MAWSVQYTLGQLFDDWDKKARHVERDQEDSRHLRLIDQAEQLQPYLLMTAQERIQERKRWEQVRAKRLGISDKPLRPTKKHVVLMFALNVLALTILALLLWSIIFM